MCKEDIREGKKKYTRSTVVAVNAGVYTPIATPSNERTHLSFGCVGAVMAVGPKGNDLATNGAYPVSAVTGPVEFDVETHGNILFSEWGGAGIGGANVIVVTETFWRDTP